ncbi:unnamed protein product [Pleuronectes platessa]|uniref:Uncharacterized protein n=1 Tax=Pleuronectes platessa TaxID=8262 RepID=A0A9N7UN54_PLEPL|nr:unnamed protein product [Pleuronectes platessa]
MSRPEMTHNRDSRPLWKSGRRCGDEVREEGRGRGDGDNHKRTERCSIPPPSPSTVSLHLFLRFANSSRAVFFVNTMNVPGNSQDPILQPMTQGLKDEQRKESCVSQAPDEESKVGIASSEVRVSPDGREFQARYRLLASPVHFLCKCF